MNDGVKADSVEGQRGLGPSAALRSIWRSPFGLTYQFPHSLIFLTAVLAPLNVLDRFPAARAFAEAVRQFLVGLIDVADIKRFADSTDYTQVALLVCALHWVWLPFSILATAVLYEYSRVRFGYDHWRSVRGPRARIDWQDLKAGAVGSVLFPMALVVVTMLPGDWSMTPGLATHSRLGMALLFWVLFWGCAMSVGSLYPMARVFIDINLRGK